MMATSNPVHNEKEEVKAKEGEIICDQEMDRKIILEKFGRVIAMDHRDEGNVLFREGKYVEAHAYYTMAEEKYPKKNTKERAMMYSNMGACNQKMGKYMEAIVDSDRALDLHSNYPKPLRRRAEMHEAVGMLDEAMKDYEKLVKIDPGHDSDKAACLRLRDKIKKRNEKRGKDWRKLSDMLFDRAENEGN